MTTFTILLKFKIIPKSSKSLLLIGPVITYDQIDHISYKFKLFGYMTDLDSNTCKNHQF